MKRRNGYTLLELLLVITVIITIAATAILMYRRHFVEERVEKTATEMQHVLEAAMAYYIDHHHWPAARSDCDAMVLVVADEDEGVTDFVWHYLPNASTRSPIGHDFCWSERHYSTRGINAQTHAPLFWTGLKVANQDHLPQRIAAHLPNGWVSESSPPSQSSDDASREASCPKSAGSCYVSAEVPVPGAGSHQAINHAAIVAMGTCDSAENNCQTSMETSEKMGGINNLPVFHIHFKSCPLGFSPKAIFMPTRFRLPRPKHSKHWEGYHIQSLRAAGHCNSALNQQGEQTCDFSIVASICHGKFDCEFRNIFLVSGDETAVAGSYLVACQPQQKGG